MAVSQQPALQGSPAQAAEVSLLQALQFSAFSTCIFGPVAPLLISMRRPSCRGVTTRDAAALQSPGTLPPCQHVQALTYPCREAPGTGEQHCSHQQPALQASPEWALGPLTLQALQALDNLLCTASRQQ